jgi:hypothetical protein
MQGRAVSYIENAFPPPLPLWHRFGLTISNPYCWSFGILSFLAHLLAYQPWITGDAHAVSVLQPSLFSVSAWLFAAGLAWRGTATPRLPRRWLWLSARTMGYILVFGAIASGITAVTTWIAGFMLALN